MCPIYSEQNTEQGADIEFLSTEETYELERQFTKFLLLRSSFTKLLETSFLSFCQKKSKLGVHLGNSWSSKLASVLACSLARTTGKKNRADAPNPFLWCIEWRPLVQVGS